MRPLWPWVRRESRLRWRSLVGLALLVAIAAGVVMAALAGARRTDSAFDRFAMQALARDARVQVDDPESFAAVGALLEELPYVAASGQATIVPLAPDPDQVRSDELDLAVFASPDGSWGTEIDRGILLRGRRVDPSAVHEVVFNELAAAQSGLDVGDRFEALTFTPEDFEVVFSGEGFPGFRGPRIALEIVGVVREADELNGSATSAGPVAHASGAFLREYRGRAGSLDLGFGVRFAEGEDRIADLRAAVRAVVEPGAEVFVVSSAEEFEVGARKAIDVSVTSLLVFTVIAAVAGSVAVGSAVSRLLMAVREADAALTALGADRRQRAAANAVPVLGAVAVGLVGGAAGAVLASSWFPLPQVRRSEPDPGVAVDAIVLGGVSTVAVLLALGWTFAVLRRPAGSHGVPDVRRRRRPFELAATFGLGPAATIGMHHALASEGASGRVPVRATTSGVAMALAGALGVATVAVSLDALLNEPERYGWGWSAEPDVLDGGPEAALDGLAADPRLEAVGLVTNAAADLGGSEVQAISLRQVSGQIEPVIRDGRPPVGPSEAALGAKTMRHLDVRIGDTVEAVTADGRSHHELVVVGEAVFRPVDNPDPAMGILVSEEALELVRRSDGFEAIVLRYPDGADRDAIEAALATDHRIGFSVYSAPRPPGSVSNLHGARSVVLAVGAFFAVIGVAGALHALVVSARNRRREFAVLRALGFTRGTIRRTLAWQALLMGAVAIAVGLPTGLVLGRLVWRVLVGDLGVLDDPTVPWSVIAASVPVVLVSSALLTLLPLRRLVRSDPTAALEVR